MISIEYCLFGKSVFQKVRFAYTFLTASLFIKLAMFHGSKNIFNIHKAGNGLFHPSAHSDFHSCTSDASLFRQISNFFFLFKFQAEFLLISSWIKYCEFCVVYL